MTGMSSSTAQKQCFRMRYTVRYLLLVVFAASVPFVVVYYSLERNRGQFRAIAEMEYAGGEVEILKSPVWWHNDSFARTFGENGPAVRKFVWVSTFFARGSI